MLWRLIKLVLVLLVLAALGLIAFAYVGPVFMPGDFDPHQEEIRIPLTLEPIE